MQTLKTKSLAWHHFDRPGAEELVWLRKRFAFHELVIEELTRPTVRPKVDAYDGYLYLVLHVPLFDATSRKTHPAEVDFILTERELISVAYEPIQPLDEFFGRCSAEKSCEELYASRTPAHLFCFVAQALYDFALRELDHIQEHINRIEGQLFAGRERAIVEELSVARRDIINFRRAVKPQLMTLESLAEHGTLLFGPELRPFFSGLIGQFTRVRDLLENAKEALDALYDNNATLLQVQENDAIRTLTLMAFVTFPLVLFAQLFSMTTVATPIVGHPSDFWIIVSLMLAAGGGMFWFFRRKGWL